VKQIIISQSNFEGIDELMCNRFKIKSLLHKLPLDRLAGKDGILMCNSFKIKSLLHKLPMDRSAGKDGILVEHIFYADSSVCNHLSGLTMCV